MKKNKNLNKILLVSGLLSLAIYFYSPPEHALPVAKIIPQKKAHIMKPIKTASDVVVENKNEIPEKTKTLLLQNRPWKNKLEKDLLAFMPAKTTLNIEVLEILNYHTKQEVAKITYRKPDGATSTFKALIESKSGKILRTWDQAIFETNPQKRISIAISGAL